jgi:hypothetical protein
MIFSLRFTSLISVASLLSVGDAVMKYKFSNECFENRECVLSTYPLYSTENECKLVLEFKPQANVLVKNQQYDIELVESQKVTFNDYNCTNNLTLVFDRNTTVNALVETETYGCITDIRCLFIISQIAAILFSIFC